jgi:hypothetical protein
MKYSRYIQLERAIAASDRGGILDRWRWGTRVLNDPKMVTPAGNLRHGRLAQLIADAKADGIVLTEQEVQRRLRCARTYRSEAEIRESAHGFKNWDELARAGFPPVQVPLDADTEPFDPRDSYEKRRDAARELERVAREEAGGQFALFDYFPAERFSQLSTLAELRKYAEEMAEWTERQADADKRRLAYVKQLLAAVHGDEGRTWADAQAALDAAQQAP